MIQHLQISYILIENVYLHNTKIRPQPEGRIHCPQHNLIQIKVIKKTCSVSNMILETNGMNGIIS